MNVYYKEWLRVRRALIIVCIGAAALLILHYLFIVATGSLSSHTAGSTNVFVIGADAGGSAHASQTDTRADDMVPLSIFFSIAGVVAAIFAGLWTGGLSEENDGHLALAWTKPVSRTRYALTLMSIDLVFVACIFALTVIFSAIITYQHGDLHLLRIDHDAWLNLTRFALVAVAFYALAQGSTASLRHHSGAVRGVVGAVAIIVAALADSHFPPLWKGLAKLVDYVNPIAYMSYSYPHPQPLQPFATWGLNLAALGAITALGITAALWQWRRLEA